MALPEQRYLSAEYITENPTWDAEDSPWKAKKVAQLIVGSGVPSNNICEVGCGAGGVLASLRSFFPDSLLSGYDIAETAKSLWDKHSSLDIRFFVGNFLEVNTEHFEIICILDVIEHLQDPFYFLDNIKKHGDYFVFHIPLDLSSVSVFRESPILKVRNTVGHIHYYTKELALSLLVESEFEIIDWKYTNASLSGPGGTWKRRLATILRQICYGINKDMGVRLLGGETLIVLAKPV